MRRRHGALRRGRRASIARIMSLPAARGQVRSAPPIIVGVRDRGRQRRERVVRRYTRDQAVIQQWVEERGGQPARVRGAEVPRIAFGAMPPNWEPLTFPEL